MFVRKTSLVALLLLGSAAHADVLVMSNGDRISGDIKKIWDGEVSIEPTYADEFSVDLASVVRIESEEQFEIEFEDGTEVTGSLAGTNDAGLQRIVTGEDTVTVPMASLYQLDEIQDDFEWESNVEFSASINEGNTESANTKIKADGMVRFSDHRHRAEVTFFREELASVISQENDLFKYSYNWLFREPFFFAADVSYERDPIIELHSRVIASAGVGLDVWNTPRKSLSVQLGIGGQDEEIGLVSTSNEVATWTLRYAHKFLQGDLEIYHNHTINENLSGRDNTSLKSTTGLRYEITDLLYGNISVDYDYESQPIDVAENEDIAILLGVGLEF